MKKILLPVCVITGFLSPNLWAQDAFNYARGSINWAYNKSDYFEGKGSDAKSYNGLSFDISKGFGTNFYGRGGMEFLSRNGGKDNCSGQLNPGTWLGRTSAFAGVIPSLC